MITESFENATLNVLIKRVNSVEGAISVCNDLKIDISDLLLEEPKSLNLKAYIELQIITKALNEGWKPNWSNQSEYKYYPWFDLRGRSFVFYYVTVYFCNTFTGGASRLCFKSRELAEYAGRTFINLYKDYLTF